MTNRHTDSWTLNNFDPAENSLAGWLVGEMSEPLETAQI